MINMLNNL